jgi:hypothetical protein
MRFSTGGTVSVPEEGNPASETARCFGADAWSYFRLSMLTMVMAACRATVGDFVSRFPLQILTWFASALWMTCVRQPAPAQLSAVGR